MICATVVWHVLQGTVKDSSRTPARILFDVLSVQMKLRTRTSYEKSAIIPQGFYSAL